MSIKDQKRFIEAYILDSIDGSGYGIELSTNIEKIQFLLDTFRKECGWNIDRKSTNSAFEEWCQGLPSCFNIVFTNHDILELAKKQGTMPENATEKQEYNILDKYWRYITMRTFELYRRLTKKEL